MTKPYLVVAGPTGGGKTGLALALAAALDGEIINCDSVQVYRGFDLGSAKPTPAQLAAVPHHLIDILAPNAPYDAAAYGRDARRALADVRSRGRLPLVVGGTGLYLRGLLGDSFHEDLPSDAALRQELSVVSTAELHDRLMLKDPQRAQSLHPNDRVRILRALEIVLLMGKTIREVTAAPRPPDPAAVVVILEPERAELHRRIERRTHDMLAAGLVAETARLLAAGVERSAKPMQSIGYLQAAAHLAGELPEAELPGAIAAATRQYAKRQCTWFRKLPAAARLSGTEAEEAVVKSLQGLLVARELS